jgi:hypothetical protein
MPAIMKKAEKPATVEELGAALEAAQARAQAAAEALRELNEKVHRARNGDTLAGDLESLMRARTDAANEATTAAGLVDAASFALSRARLAAAKERTKTEVPAAIAKAVDKARALEIALHDMHEMLSGGSLMDPRDVLAPDAQAWADIDALGRRITSLEAYWRTHVANWIQR